MALYIETENYFVKHTVDVVLTDEHLEAVKFIGVITDSNLLMGLVYPKFQVVFSTVLSLSLFMRKFPVEENEAFYKKYQLI